MKSEGKVQAKHETGTKDKEVLCRGSVFLIGAVTLPAPLTILEPWSPSRIAIEMLERASESQHIRRSPCQLPILPQFAPVSLGGMPNDMTEHEPLG